MYDTPKEQAALLIEWWSGEEWCARLEPSRLAMILKVEESELETLDGLEDCKCRWKLETLDGAVIEESIAYEGAAVLEWWGERQLVMAER
jgi:hypothetical protein